MHASPLAVSCDEGSETCADIACIQHIQSTQKGKVEALHFLGALVPCRTSEYAWTLAIVVWTKE